MMRVTSLCLTSLSELLCLFLLIPGFTRTLVSPCFVCKEYWIVLWLCQVVFTCRPHLSQRSLQSIFCVSTPSCRKGFFPLDRFIISISLQLWFFCFGYTDRPFFIFSHVLVFCFVATFLCYVFRIFMCDWTLPDEKWVYSVSCSMNFLRPLRDNSISSVPELTSLPSFAVIISILVLSS